MWRILYCLGLVVGALLLTRVRGATAQTRFPTKKPTLAPTFRVTDSPVTLRPTSEYETMAPTSPLRCWIVGKGPIPEVPGTVIPCTVPFVYASATQTAVDFDYCGSTQAGNLLPFRVNNELYSANRSSLWCPVTSTPLYKRDDAATRLQWGFCECSRPREENAVCNVRAGPTAAALRKWKPDLASWAIAAPASPCVFPFTYNKVRYFDCAGINKQVELEAQGWCMTAPVGGQPAWGACSCSRTLPPTKSPTTLRPTTRSPTPRFSSSPTTASPSTLRPTRAPVTSMPSRSPTYSPTTSEPTVSPTLSSLAITSSFLVRPTFAVPTTPPGAIVTPAPTFISARRRRLQDPTSSPSPPPTLPPRQPETFIYRFQDSFKCLYSYAVSNEWPVKPTTMYANLLVRPDCVTDAGPVNMPGCWPATMVVVSGLPLSSVETPDDAVGVTEKLKSLVDSENSLVYINGLWVDGRVEYVAGPKYTLGHLTTVASMGALPAAFCTNNALNLTAVTAFAPTPASLVPQDDSGMSGGEIAALVICLLLLILVAAVFWNRWLVAKQRQHQNLKEVYEFEPGVTSQPLQLLTHAPLSSHGSSTAAPSSVRSRMQGLKSFILGEPMYASERSQSDVLPGFEPMSMPISSLNSGLPTATMTPSHGYPMMLQRNGSDAGMPMNATVVKPQLMLSPLNVNSVSRRDSQDPASATVMGNSNYGTVSGQGTAGVGIANARQAGFQDFSIDLTQLKLGSIIGSGANGRIFKAKYHGSDVAVKELFSQYSDRNAHPGETEPALAYAGDYQAPEGLLREFSHLRLLKHPNVIQLYGLAVARSAETNAPRYLLVMELADMSLDKQIPLKAQARDSGVLNADELIEWATETAKQLAGALAFVHERGLIHFDIKPHNVLLDKSGNAKLCDLGISKLVGGHGDRDLTLTNGGKAGTPSYMAPELLHGETKKISTAVDVYAFGIVMWQLFHLKPPHSREWSVAQLFDAVMNQGHRPAIDPNITPAPLIPLIEQCWAEDHHERPTCLNVSLELETFMRERDTGHINALENVEAVVYETGDRVQVYSAGLMRFVTGEVLVVQNPTQPNSNGPRNKRRLAETRTYDVVLADGTRIMEVSAENLFPMPSTSIEGVGGLPSAPPNLKLRAARVLGELNETSTVSDIAGALAVARSSQKLTNRWRRGSVGSMDSLHSKGSYLGGAPTTTHSPLHEPPSASSNPPTSKKHSTPMSTASSAGVAAAKRATAKIWTFASRMTAPSGADLTESSNSEVDVPPMSSKVKHQVSGEVSSVDGNLRRTRTGPTPSSDRSPSVSATTFTNPNGSAVSSPLGPSRDLSSVPALTPFSFRFLPSVRTQVASTPQQAPTVLSRSSSTMLPIEPLNISTTPKIGPSLVLNQLSQTSSSWNPQQLDPLATTASSLHHTPTRGGAAAAASGALASGATFRFDGRALSMHGLLISESGVKGHNSGNVGGDAASVALSHPMLETPETPSSTEEEGEEAYPSISASSLVRMADLGSGAAGFVYSALDVDTFQVYAVKEVKFLERASRHQALREIKSLRQLRHPNIVRLMNVFLNPGSENITMVLEYINGGSLQDLIDESGPARTNQNRVLVHEMVLQRVAYDVSLALEHCHGKGIAHLDVKPSNILLGLTGSAKLADFGLARTLQSEAQASTFIGTTKYMSPERLRGKTYGFPSDVWGLGLSLVAAAMGRFPYDVSSAQEPGVYWALLELLEQGQVPKLPQASFTQNALDFVHQTLLLNPEARPTSGALLAHPWLADVVAPVASASSRVSTPAHDPLSCTTRFPVDAARIVLAEVADAVVQRITQRAAEKREAANSKSEFEDEGAVKSSQGGLTTTLDDPEVAMLSSDGPAPSPKPVPPSSPLVVLVEPELVAALAQQLGVSDADVRNALDKSLRASAREAAAKQQSLQMPSTPPPGNPASLGDTGHFSHHSSRNNMTPSPNRLTVSVRDVPSSPLHQLAMSRTLRQGSSTREESTTEVAAHLRFDEVKGDAEPEENAVSKDSQDDLESNISPLRTDAEASN